LPFRLFDRTGTGGAFGFEAGQISAHVTEAGRIFELSGLGLEAQIQSLAATFLGAQSQLFGGKFSDFRGVHLRSSPKSGWFSVMPSGGG
jgi:hypothetical protein